ncbi:MAG: transcriptional regulator, partial [Hyphomicrobiaceae bacterium]
ALTDLGIDMAALESPQQTRERRVLCRPCLDWSERRWHIAGRLGSALLARSLDQGWIRRISGTRAIKLTPAGERGLVRTLRLEL